MFHNNFKPSPDLIVALCNLIRLFLDNQLSIAKYDISALLVVLCTSMKYLNGGGGVIHHKIQPKSPWFRTLFFRIDIEFTYSYKNKLLLFFNFYIYIFGNF